MIHSPPPLVNHHLSPAFVLVPTISLDILSWLDGWLVGWLTHLYRYRSVAVPASYVFLNFKEQLSPPTAIDTNSDSASFLPSVWCVVKRAIFPSSALKKPESGHKSTQ